MPTNKNKIEELEKRILNDSKTKDKLAVIMDPFLLGIEEMQKSFSSIFIAKNWQDNRITIEMDKFENSLPYFKK